MAKHDIFKKAYSEHIIDITETQIIWRDGTKMPVNITESKLLVPFSKIEQRNYQEKLNDPVILDQISIAYIPGQEGIIKAQTVVDYDPGRIRYMPFFKKMYGTNREEVKNNLVEVKWLPNVLKSKCEDDASIKLEVTKINNVVNKIESISSKLEAVLTDEQIKQYLDNPGGTFCWREIAGTNRLSAHSFGMTIGISAESNYWLWDYQKEHNLDSIKVDVREEDIDANSFPSYRNTINTIPETIIQTIIQTFNEEGFIWGGHWYHYDTMHFEYRPELLPNLIGEHS
ncbi:M15 family metallopeptidase [Candidatus Tisiphia endosymbiont of Nemotelus uliginosus]|uniref:M15 family metallopeptidase n=1 Tax=Candidatus Tisiphia endosymbiont of Nemotelus uliginosus TaxID=3077926 RepID=UPI0035C8A23B